MAYNRWGIERSRAAVEGVGARSESPSVRRSLVLAAALAAAVAAPAQAQTGGSEFVAAPRAGVLRLAGVDRSRRDADHRLPDRRPAAAGARAGGPAPGGRRTARRDAAPGPAADRPQPDGDVAAELAPGRYTARLRATTLNRRGARSLAAAGGRDRGAAGDRRLRRLPGAGHVLARRAGGALRRRADRPHAPGPGHPRRGRHADRRAAHRLRQSWRAFQKDGAGHYVVLRGDDGRDYVFMHMVDGSVLVQKGQAVAAGQQLGAVGSHRPLGRAAPALRDLARRLVLEQDVEADRPAARPARLGRVAWRAWTTGSSPSASPPRD